MEPASVDNNVIKDCYREWVIRTASADEDRADVGYFLLVTLLRSWMVHVLITCQRLVQSRRIRRQEMGSELCTKKKKKIIKDRIYYGDSIVSFLPWWFDKENSLTNQWARREEKDPRIATWPDWLETRPRAILITIIDQLASKCIKYEIGQLVNYTTRSKIDRISWTVISVSGENVSNPNANLCAKIKKRKKEKKKELRW